MALKAELKSLEGLSEPIAAEYKKVEKDDGSVVYRPDIEEVGGLRLADVKNLTQSIEKERTNGRVLRQYKEVFDSVTDARSAKDKLEDLEGQVEDLKAKGGKGLGESEKKEMERVHREALETERVKAERYRGELKRMLRVEGNKELREAGFGEAADLLEDRFVSHLDLRERDDGRFYSVVLNDDGDGERMMASEDGQTRLMTPGDLAKEFAKNEKFKRYLDAQERKTDKPDGDGRHEGPGKKQTQATGTTEDGLLSNPVEALKAARRAQMNSHERVAGQT